MSLCAAAAAGDAEAVRAALMHQESIDTTQNGRSSLHLAVEGGHCQVCELLLEAGADVNAYTAADARPPLHVAAGSGNEAMVRLLLDAGAKDKPINGDDGDTAESAARANGHNNVATLIAEFHSVVTPLRSNQGIDVTSFIRGQSNTSTNSGTLSFGRGGSTTSVFSQPVDPILYSQACSMRQAVTTKSFMAASNFLVAALHQIWRSPETAEFRTMNTTSQKVNDVFEDAASQPFMESIGFVVSKPMHYEISGDVSRLQLAEEALVSARKDLNEFEAWALFAEDLEIDDCVGSGTFGEVFRGTLVDRAVAVKKLKSGYSDKARELLVAEANLMKNFKHHNVLRLVGHVFSKSECSMVVELMSSGFLDVLRSAKFSTSEQLSFATEIAAGLDYLHEEGVIHCDLACRNILLSPSRDLKICDFGLARLADSEDSYLAGKQEPISIRWAAPDIFSLKKLTKETDIWSYGVVLHELVTGGAVPYMLLSNAEVLEKVAKGFRLPMPRDCDKQLYQLMSKCWKHDPKKRPDTADILRDLMALKVQRAMDDCRRQSVSSTDTIGRKKKGFSWPRIGRRKLAHEVTEPSVGAFSYYYKHLASDRDNNPPPELLVKEYEDGHPVEQQPWYHGTLTEKRVRENIEPLLKYDGDFALCRTRTDDMFILTVLWVVPQQIVLLPQEDGSYCLGENTYFRDMMGFMDFYYRQGHILPYAGESLELRRGVHPSEVISNDKEFDAIILYQPETDGAIARELYLAMQTQHPGLRCFLDQYDLDEGGYYDALVKSRNVLCLLSEKSLLASMSCDFKDTCLAQFEVAMDLQQLQECQFQLSFIPVFVGQYLTLPHPRKRKTFQVYEEFDMFDVAKYSKTPPPPAKLSPQEVITGLMSLKDHGVYVDPRADLTDACTELARLIADSATLIPNPKRKKHSRRTTVKL